MKRTSLASCKALFLVLLALVTAAASFAATTPYAPVQNGFDPVGQPAELFAPGRILIKFKAASMERSRLQVGMQKGSSAATLETGFSQVDAVSRQYQLYAISRPFIPVLNRAEGRRLGLDRVFLFEVPVAVDVEEAVKAYASDPNVEYATPDWRAFPAAVPTDPAYAQHWGHNNTAQLPGLDWGGTFSHTLPTTVGTPGFDANAQAGWDGTQGFGSASVIIAIIDSGVDIDHPDLSLVAGWDYGSGDSNPDDNASGAGHGTACAGVAAARANNGLGACGAAPGCRIMPLKAANNAGSLFFSAIVNCIIHAADNGANIISMSLGAAISSEPSTDSAISYANSAGVTILAATGNENRSTISYPAINSLVIGVGAASPCGERKRSSSSTSELNPGVSPDPNGYTCDGERWWGSNYGTNVQNAAGAVDIIAPTILYTTDIGGAAGFESGDYEPFFNGTSCATPYAAGVCALIKSKNPGFTPAQVRQQLVSTAQDIISVESGSGWDRYTGYGMVDAAAAVGGGGGPVAPVAAFVGTPLSGTAPLLVSFTDQSSGSPTSWSWNFGDGGTSTAQNPSHTYNTAGSYTVTLTASNAAGSDPEVKTNYITVSAPSGFTTITFDDFESGMGSYTDGGADMSRYTGGTFAWQGVAAADIQDNSGVASSFFHTGNHNVTGYNTLEVEFFFRSVSMENGENFFVEYFNGSVYQVVANFIAGTHFTNSGFWTTTVTIPRSSFTFPTNAKIRFRCDASNNSDDIYIDSITFRGTTSVLAAAGPVASMVPRTGREELSPATAALLTTELLPARPNPFNPTTTISFSLAEDSDVVLRVFDVKGREVAKLIDGPRQAGTHQVQFDAGKLSSGLYFYRLEAGDTVQLRKMTLLK